jgi:hypothetical protein
MHKRTWAALAAAGTVVGGGLVLGAGTAAGADTSGTVLHYTATYVKGDLVDAKPAGDSIGDRSADLFRIRTSDGRAAGDLTDTCTLFRPGARPLAQCEGLVSLDDGNVLTLAGSTNGSAVTTYAVTGGTGRFAGAGGVFRVDGGGHVTITLASAR